MIYDPAFFYFGSFSNSIHIPKRIYEELKLHDPLTLDLLFMSKPKIDIDRSIQ